MEGGLEPLSHWAITYLNCEGQALGWWCPFLRVERNTPPRLTLCYVHDVCMCLSHVFSLSLMDFHQCWLFFCIFYIFFHSRGWELLGWWSKSIFDGFPQQKEICFKMLKSCFHVFSLYNLSFALSEHTLIYGSKPIFYFISWSVRR